MIHSSDEELLARFRQWLAETRIEVDQQMEASATPPDVRADSKTVGLYRLVEEFTAMRHELKLQTRGARGQEENVQKLLGGLQQAIEAFQTAKPRDTETAAPAGKSLAIAIAELDEALSRGREQLDKAAAALSLDAKASLAGELEKNYRSQSAWDRWRSRNYHQRLMALLANADGSTHSRAVVNALLDGYALIQQRLNRAMATEGIARIATIGEKVDPERMVVIEVVQEHGPPGVVVEEIRPGYVWNNRLLRCAEVRATRL